MDDVYTRAKYTRYSGTRKVRDRRRKKGFAGRVVRQLLISITILLAVWFFKGVDTPAAKYGIEKIRWVTQKNISLESVYRDLAGLFGSQQIKTLPPDKADPGEKTVSEKAVPVIADFNESLAVSASFICPIEGYVTRTYGEKINPLKKSLWFHSGIDIEPAGETAVRAAREGTITGTGSSEMYGPYIRIRHEGGWETVYAHCSEITAVMGEQVEAGEIIADVAPPEGTLSSHLHFEIWRDGLPVDPLDYLEGTRGISK